MAIGHAQRERKATLLEGGIIIVIIAVVAVAVGAFEYRWITQPPPSSTLLDINTATVNELTTLPEIDESTATKIVTGRPYNRTGELVEKDIIPQTTYDKIRDQIVAKQR